MSGVITPADLRRLVSYEPHTGSLVWKCRDIATFATESAGRTWNSRYAGKPAFSVLAREGYLKGKLGSIDLQAHRVAWAIHYGEWPSGPLDHIDGDVRNNSIANLRVACRVENGRNAKRSRANTSGCTGVSIRRLKGGALTWVARIFENGSTRHLGQFNCFDEAFRARKDAERSLCFHPNHGRAA